MKPKKSPVKPGSNSNVQRQPYPNNTDFASIAETALNRIDQILDSWLPGGKRQGSEYVVRNPLRQDKRPGSFSVNVVTGQWSDFATTDTGGDLVSLVAYLDRCNQHEAAGRLADFLGISNISDPGDTARSRPTVSLVETNQGKGDPWRPITPVPDDAPPPPRRHYRHGEPARTWTYRDTAGRVLFHVLRFDIEPRKQILPLTFCQDANGKKAWRWKALNAPRPLYHLDHLTARPDASVLICEGEKAADAAGQLFPDWITTTPPNGAQSPRKADWSPLRGRTVYLWPDADGPGRDFAATVAELVEEAGAARVLELRLDSFRCTPRRREDGQPTWDHWPRDKALPEGWDAADALAEGWTADHGALLLTDPAFLQPTAARREAVRQEAEAINAAFQEQRAANRQTREHLPRFELLAKGRPGRPAGVYWLGMDKEDNPLPPEWICSYLEVTAETRDHHGEGWGRLLEFPDRDGRRHRWAMPMEMLAGSGEELRRELLRQGLTITSSSKARVKLADYIQQACPDLKARCVERTGWHDGAFVFPSRTLGETNERVLFQADTTRGFTYGEAGSLDDWKTHVAALCVGNSRLAFAVSCAFAALLLEPAGDESGGFHLRGDSSSGKTTALRVAASVYGPPAYLQRWRATDNGLEALAVLHNDTLLILDELAQMDPRAAGEACYMLANGEGKTRAGRSGSARPRASWRLLFLSAGEIGLADHMKTAGKKARAGQETRLADIPAVPLGGFGIFETLHDQPSGAALSRALIDAASRHYGTPAPAFLAAILPQRAQLTGTVAALRRDFLAEALPEDANGQATRVAGRFALAAIGGELATLANVTGWPPGEAKRAALFCFRAWLDARGGGGNQEQAAMLAQVRHFFEAHGEARFTPWPRDGETCERCQGRGRLGWTGHEGGQCFDCGGTGKLGAAAGKRLPTRDRAGFRREGEDGTEYFVLTETFRDEVCSGFDAKAVARLLVERRILATDGDGKTSKRERLPGMGRVRCYVFTPVLWEIDL